MIKNILKDGTEVQDLTGTVIKQSDFPTVYQIIEQIERKENADGDQV